MANLNVNLDEKAVKAVGLGKAVARGEGDRRLDTVHVFKAALLAFRDEVALHVREICGAWPDVMWDVVTAPEGFRAESDRMPVTKELAALVRKLGRDGKVVTLGVLLNALLRNQSVRVKSLMSKARGTDQTSGHRRNTGGARPRHRSKADWLLASRCEWELRRDAAQAAGILVSFRKHTSSRDYLADVALDTVARIAASNRAMQDATPRELDPLTHIAEDLDSVQRAVCDAYLVDRLFGLEVHPFGGLAPRDLAQMFSPELYPGNCRRVLEVVDDLKIRGFLLPRDTDSTDRLTTGLELADELLDEVLLNLERDAISAGEFRAAKRQLRLGREYDPRTFLPSNED